MSTGRIDFLEIKQSLADLGIEITRDDAERILKRYFCFFLQMLINGDKIYLTWVLIKKKKILFVVDHSREILKLKPKESSLELVMFEVVASVRD